MHHVPYPPSYNLNISPSQFLPSHHLAVSPSHHQNLTVTPSLCPLRHPRYCCRPKCSSIRRQAEDKLGGGEGEEGQNTDGNGGKTKSKVGTWWVRQIQFAKKWPRLVNFSPQSFIYLQHPRIGGRHPVPCLSIHIPERQGREQQCTRKIPTFSRFFGGERP